MVKKIAMMFWCLPQNLLSKIIGGYCKSIFSKPLIRLFSTIYRIDTSIAEKKPSDYRTLNEFFTRRLKKGARNIQGCEMEYISPVDGTIAVYGDVEKSTLIQAKGIDYSLEALLGEESLAKRFEEGKYMTIYLSPSDYHRIHMPIDGKINGYNYIPGRLFPVNTLGVYHIPGLFTKNERLITVFEHDSKKIAVVKVGAFIVGSTKVTYDTISTNKGFKQSSVRFIEKLDVKRGQEIGWFEFGSTVILLFEKSSIEWNESLAIGKKIKMGENIGKHLD